MRIIILIIFLLLPLQVFAQTIQPTYKQGYAKNISETSNPELWKGLVGAWIPVLGNSGLGTLPDVSGFGNDGTIDSTQVASDWRIGNNPRLRGYVLNFDGTDDEVESQIILSDFNDLTINVWVNLADWTNANTQNEVFVGTRGLGFTNSVSLYAIASQDRVAMRVRGGAEINVHYDYGSSIISGWHMVTGQTSQVRAFNGAHSVGVWFDADNSSQLQQQAANLWAPVTSPTLKIAAAPESSDFMAGEIGSVHVWNRILREDEIKQLFRFGNSVSMFRTKQPVLARAAAAVPGGIPIFRRRIEGY